MEYHILKAKTGAPPLPKDLYVLVAAETPEHACRLVAEFDGQVPRSSIEHVASGGLAVDGPERVIQRCTTCMAFSF